MSRRPPRLKQGRSGADQPPRRRLSLSRTCGHAPVSLGRSRSLILPLIRVRLFIEGRAPFLHSTMR